MHRISITGRPMNRARCAVKRPNQVPTQDSRRHESHANACAPQSLQRPFARLPDLKPSPNRPPMYARRFLGCVLVLTLLAVVGAFAIYQWGGRVLLKQAVPHGHFEAAKAGSGPDYSQAGSWIARPDLADDPSRWQPDNGR